MKCFRHQTTDAVAVCVHCGRSLCEDCVVDRNATRLVCSSECQKALTQSEMALRLLLDKSSQSARASAFYCYLTAGLSAAAAVAAWFMLPSPFLIYFTGACSVVLFAAGFWYSRGART